MSARVRPAAIVATSFAAGILAYSWLEPPLWVVFCNGALGVGAGLWGTLRRAWWMGGGAVLAVASLGVGRAFLDDLSSPNDIRYVQAENVAALVGEIADDPDVRRGSTLFRLRVEAVRTRDGTLVPASGLTQVRWGRCDTERFLRYGQRIELSGKLEALRASRGRGDLSYANYLKGFGIRTLFYAVGDAQPIILQAQGGNRVLKAAYTLRRSLMDSFERNLQTDNLPLALGVCFGTQAYLPLDVRENFAASGTVHILSASGMHVAAIAAALSWCLMAVGIRRRNAAVSSLFAVAIYAVMAGLSPPIVRAGLMFGICSAAYFFKRAPDWPSGLYVSAIAILAVHPYALFDVGFELSYLCVLSLFYLRGLYAPLIDAARARLAPRGRNVPRTWRAAFAMLQLGARRVPQGTLKMVAQRATQKAAVGVLEVVFASLAVQLGTLPAIMHYFGQTQWVGVAANVVIVPLSSAVLILSVIGAVISPLIPLAGGIGYTAADWAATRTLETAEFFAKIPGAGYSAGAVSPLVFLVYYVALLLATRKLTVRRREAARRGDEREEAAVASYSA